MTSNDQPSSDALLSAARRGDPDALNALLERHQGQIYRFSYRMCRDAEDAEDVLQDTLLTLARGVRDFRGSASLSTWLFTVARSFCIKKRRRSRSAPEESPLQSGDDGELAAEAIDPARLPDEVVAGRQVEAALEQAIRSLDPMYREVLLLRDVEGLTAPQVAEVLGITPQAVKSRLHRGRRTVRDRVAPLLGIPGDAPAAPGACPDVLGLYSQHLEGEISQELCVQMERHLEGCPRCTNTCDSLKQTLALCRTSPAPAVPTEVQRQVKQALRGVLSEGA